MNTLDTKKVKDSMMDVVTLSEVSGGELAKAINKHPLFPDRLTDLTHENVLYFLSRQRAKNDTGPDTATGSSVFHEEWGEFLEAVQNGDKAAALHELSQCIAMLFRIGIHLDDYMPKGK